MSDDMLVVNFAALEQASTDIQNALSQMDTHLADVEADAAPLLVQWSGAAQDAYHACLAHTFFYFQPQRPEVVCNDLSRPEFMIAQFRVFMEVSSPGDGFWFDLICCRTNEGSEIIFLSRDVQRRQEKAKRKKKGSSHVG